MTKPMFFHEGIFQSSAEVQLDEDTARHVVQVLRMQQGGELRLTNGNGSVAAVSISRAEKKKCFVVIEDVATFPPPAVKLHLGVAFTKNTSRNEWLLEKATELGASSIIPLVATRTERERLRYDRWRNILIAALIQSQQYYLPTLHEATGFKEILQRFNAVPQKLIGHCIETEMRTPLTQSMKPGQETIMLIGPEGDFTPEEVTTSIKNGFSGVLLGHQRLRTETAAMSVCAYFNLINTDEA